MRIGVNLILMLISRFVSLALSLVLSHIIFESLGQEETGRWGFALGYASLFSVFATLGIQRVLVRDIASDSTMAWTRVWTAEALVLCLSAIMMGAIYISVLSFESDPKRQAAVICAALSLVLLWALQRPFEALLVAKERMGWIAIANITAALLKVVAVYFMMHSHPTSANAHLAIAGANGLVYLLVIAFTIHVAGWERPRVRITLALHQIRECLPFTVAMLFSLLYFKADMVLLGKLSGDAATGIYTPPQRIMESLLMVAGIWGTVIFPALCRCANREEERYERLQQSSIRLALVASMPMAFGLAALSGPIIGLLTGDKAGDFAESPLVLAILCGITPFFYLNSLGQEALYAIRRYGFVIGCYALAAAVSVAANLVVIPRFGVPGVATVAVFVNALISVLFLWKMRVNMDLYGLIPLVAKTLVACCIMATVAFYTASVSLVAALIMGVLVYGIAQTLLRTLNLEERHILRSMLATLLRRT
jgi:O-antigen/teichoic acid export membrane protein